MTPEPPPLLGAQLPQPPESASFREAGPWSSANVLQETKFKNVAVAGLHSSEDEPDRPGPRVAACGKLGAESKGGGERCRRHSLLKGVAGSRGRVDTSLPGSVFLPSIINHRDQAGRIGVLAIVQRAGPNT